MCLIKHPPYPLSLSRPLFLLAALAALSASASAGTFKFADETGATSEKVAPAAAISEAEASEPLADSDAVNFGEAISDDSETEKRTPRKIGGEGRDKVNEHKRSSWAEGSEGTLEEKRRSIAAAMLLFFQTFCFLSCRFRYNCLIYGTSTLKGSLSSFYLFFPPFSQTGEGPVSEEGGKGEKAVSCRREKNPCLFSPKLIGSRSLLLSSSQTFWQISAPIIYFPAKYFYDLITSVFV